MTAGISLRERLTRTIHAAGLRLAGERGGHAANTLTDVLRLGRIDLCPDPACTDCAPAAV
ncbi:hypothetical protein [Streptomyces sp. DT171]|uniref:hypothetical protein n=1 Tax=Streptomyces sp. DT171 TaxID=3416524 RepID=UPI003CEDEE5F